MKNSSHNVKYSLIALFIAMSTQGLQAQSSWGVFTGVEFSRFKGEEASGQSYEIRKGFVFGTRFDTKLTDDISLSLRPHFSQGGSDIGVKDTTNRQRIFLFPIKNSSIAIAALTHVEMSNIMYALAGLDLGYIVSSKASIFESEIDIVDQIKPLNAGVSFGFGFNIPTKTGQFNLEVQGTYGLTRITKKNDIGEFPSPLIRTMRFRATVHYLFPIKKKK